MKSYKSSFLMLFLLTILLAACSTDEETANEVNSQSGSGESEEQIQEVEARIAHVYPPDLFISKGYDMFAELVAEKSDGKVNFTVYPAGQLYTDVAAPNAVSSGQIEMGINTLEMWSSNIPATEFSTLPIFDGYEHVRKSFENGLEDVLKEELNKLNVEPLLWAEFGFAYISSKDTPLDTPESFVNRKVRTTSPLMSEFIELAGGSPVAISGGEVPQALQRGTIDAAVSGVAGFSASKYYEYTDYYTGPFNAGLVLLSANLEWWNGLNNPTQQVILEAVKETEDWLKDQQQIVYDESVSKIEAEGMKYKELNKDDFAEIIQELNEQYKDRSGDLGEKILQIVEENR